MRWKYQDPEEWHRTFVFFPKQVDGYWVWLEFVERRQVRFLLSCYWEYRLP